MTTSNPGFFPARHIDRLPRPLARALSATVLLLHGLLVAMALRSIPLVELGGSSGGGGSGGSTLYVSVLSGQPAANVSRTQPTAVASENTRMTKEKPQSGLIATRSASKSAVQTAPTIEKKTVKQTESTPLQQQTADKTAGTATTKGMGSNTDRGTGKGTGNENNPGTERTQATTLVPADREPDRHVPFRSRSSVTNRHLNLNILPAPYSAMNPDKSTSRLSSTRPDVFTTPVSFPLQDSTGSMKRP